MTNYHKNRYTNNNNIAIKMNASNLKLERNVCAGSSNVSSSCICKSSVSVSARISDTLLLGMLRNLRGFCFPSCSVSSFHIIEHCWHGFSISSSCILTHSHIIFFKAVASHSISQSVWPPCRNPPSNCTAWPWNTSSCLHSNCRAVVNELMTVSLSRPYSIFSRGCNDSELRKGEACALQVLSSTSATFCCLKQCLAQDISHCTSWFLICSNNVRSLWADSCLIWTLDSCCKLARLQTPSLASGDMS